MENHFPQPLILHGRHILMMHDGRKKQRNVAQPFPTLPEHPPPGHIITQIDKPLVLGHVSVRVFVARDQPMEADEDARVPDDRPVDLETVEHFQQIDGHEYPFRREHLVASAMGREDNFEPEPGLDGVEDMCEW